MMFLPRTGAGRASTPQRQQNSKHAPDDTPLAIEIAALSKVYHRGKGAQVRAVDTLSLAVPAGQVVAFLGPNGAGKTTSIKMLGGVVTPTSRHGHLHGFDLV